MEMAAASVDALMAAESRLTRSFIGAAVVWLAGIVWTLFMAPRTESGGFAPSWIAVVLLVLQIGFYIWYALSAGAAAKILGSDGWKFVAWILAAPLLGLLPIPIVSTVIAASPLSIKFLLGGQLQSAIRDRTVSELHGSA